MKQAPENQTRLFATDFSRWFGSPPEYSSRLQPGFPGTREARLKPAQDTRFCSADHRLKSAANKKRAATASLLPDRSWRVQGVQA